MSYYNKFSSESLNVLKKLNDNVGDEESKDIPDNKKILKLKYQILMKGLETSVGFDINNYNRYIKI